MLNEMIRDRIVCGVSSGVIQSKLLAETDLTLDSAVKIAVALETAEWNTLELKQKASSELDASSSVKWVNQSRTSTCKDSKQSASNFRSSSTSEKRTEKKKCSRCLSWKHDGSNCPFKNKVCFQCRKVGHTRAVHAASTVFNVETCVEESQSEEDQLLPQTSDVYSLFRIASSRSAQGVPPLKLQVMLNGRNTTMEVDTGAAASVMTETEFTKLCGSDVPLQVSSRFFRSYTGERIPIKGVADVEVTVNNQTATVPLVVVQGRGASLLGRDWLTHFKLDWSRLLSEVGIFSLQVESEFSEVFKDELGCYNKGKARLLVDDSARPKFFKSRSVPLALQEKVDKELARLEEKGIIKPVTVSDWAAPIVVVPKPNGQVRICGDFKLTVNKVAALEQYPLPKVDELFTTLSGCKIFSKLDMSQAYNQIELDEESQKYCVINTPQGLKMFTRLPFGIHSAVAIFQKLLSSLLAGIPCVAVFLDDVVVGGRTREEHDSNLTEVLRRMSEAGLRLNHGKCQLRLQQVTYLGHRISGEGIQPTKEKTSAIWNAPPPSDRKTLKAWLGLLNYYSKFLNNAATVLAPLYALLRDGQPWEWNYEQQQAFLKAKHMILSAPCLAHFDDKLETVVACDASPYGVGCVLSQVQRDGVERPIAFYSRTLNDAERKYSQTDREGLSIVVGVKKWHFFLYGRPFVLKTDHKPLLGLFGEDKPLPVFASPRVQRWAILLSTYKYMLKYSPASQHCHCDALSRLPLSGTPQKVPVPAEFLHLMELLNAGPVKQEQIRGWTSKDPVPSAVLRMVQEGWPTESSNFHVEIQPYKNRQNELSVQDGCLFWGSRIVVPPQGRKAVLSELHEGHLGICKMKGRSRSYFWWPGLDRDVEELASGCQACQEQKAQLPPSELRPWPWPEQPWSRVHLDYCGPFEGHMWLVLVDAHSKWIDIHKTSSASAAVTVDKCRLSFATFGVPACLVSDNAPCFTGLEFQSFTKLNGINHLTSPPWSPKSNGLAERAVQTFKQGMKKQKTGSLEEKLCRFLFHYRSSPHSITGCSPAELMFGRPMRTHLDLLRRDSKKTRVEHYQLKQKLWYDQHTRSRSFKVGDSVFVFSFPKASQGSKWLPGTVTQSLGSSCVVTLLDGREFRRHVDHIRLRDMVLPEVRESVITPQGQQRKWQQQPSLLPAVPSAPTAGTTGEGSTSTAELLSPQPVTQSSGSPLTRASSPEPVMPTSKNSDKETPASSIPQDAIPTSTVPQSPVQAQPSPLRRSSRVSRKPDRYGYM